MIFYQTDGHSRVFRIRRVSTNQNPVYSFIWVVSTISENNIASSSSPKVTVIRLHLSRGALVSSFFTVASSNCITGFVLTSNDPSLISATFTNEDGNEEAIAGCKVKMPHFTQLRLNP